jgi:acyl-CoA synthetase (AMP-forming)/AMP-acid ligase II
MKQHFEVDISGSRSLLDVLRSRASDLAEQRVFSFHTPAQGDVADVHLSYGTLDQRARALGARLQELGLDGERAVLLYPPGLEFIPAFFGCLAAGVIAVPTHLPRPNRPMDRLRAIVEDARPRVVLTTAALSAERPRWSAQVPALDEMHWLASEGDGIGGDAALAEDWRDPGVGPGTLAFLQYTSGSTAVPKGVMVTHGNLLHNSALIQGRFRSTPESRGVFWLPLHHDMGLIGGVLQTIYCGGASTLMAPVAFLQDPIGWLEVISRTGATIGGGPNFAYDLCVRKIEGNPERRGALDLGRWTVAFNGAEPIRAETLDRFAEAFAPCGFRREAFLPCYGLAEATLMVAGHRAPALPVVLNVDAASLEQNRVRRAFAADPATKTLVASGAASAGQEIVIVDPATGRACPADGVGEIWVAGPSVADGYWGRPEDTAETFRAIMPDTGAGPFLRTGDLGFLEDGELFVTGRLKDLMIIRGRNVYPQDIESTVARSHPLLRADSGAAFSVEADGVERLVVASEVERQAGPGRAEEIIGAIRQAIAEEHELEADGVLLLKVGSIPRTSSGKIRRHACRERFLAGDLDLFGSSNRLSEPRPVDADPATKTQGAPPGRSARDRRVAGSAAGRVAGDRPVGDRSAAALLPARAGIDAGGRAGRRAPGVAGASPLADALLRVSHDRGPRPLPGGGGGGRGRRHGPCSRGRGGGPGDRRANRPDRHRLPVPGVRRARGLLEVPVRGGGCDRRDPRRPPGHPGRCRWGR